MTTETTFDFGAKSRIEALSSRMTPMKMKRPCGDQPRARQRRGDVLQRNEPVGADDPARVLKLGVNALEGRFGLRKSDRHLFG